MFKDVVRSLDTGSLAIVGLVAFILAFVLIVARVVSMKKSERTAHKNLPLEDDENPHV
ncbi:MAG: hypothetical protein RIE53_06130 [Rhodothermales bacterium]